ncbi:MFS transporter [Clostridium sp. AWRP]|uniref:MFS transporter n=1 Tax=Clostridium sp. AWRP TaxID=2212991 RepID=UPI001585DF6A|nr:MFS transporter [Clostridium sp. AWRP]
MQSHRVELAWRNDLLDFDFAFSILILKRSKVEMKNNYFNSELKNFYIFIIGQFVSQFGNKITSYGLILWSYKQSGSVLFMSLLSVCYLVPEVLFNFIAGTISDCWNKKKILLISDVIAAMFSLSIILMMITNTLEIENLYVINFMLGITDAFQNPASDVVVSAIVSKDNYIKTNSMFSFCDSFTGIFSPIVATALYAFYGLKLIVAIDLSTFVFEFVTLVFFVKIPSVDVSGKTKKDGLWKQCKSGMQYLFKSRGILSIILFMAFVNFIAAIYNTNLAPMVLSRTDNNYNELGIVSSTESIAVLIGSLLVVKIPQSSKRIPLILNVMTFSFLFGNTLLGIGHNYYVWTIAVFAGSLLVPLLMANVDYIMRTKVPFEMQGRVFSARNTLQYMSIPIGNLLGGFLADKVFEPYMKKSALIPALLAKVVGDSNGSGIALLYVCIGLIGFVGCCLFRLNKSMRKLDSVCK